MKFSIRDLLLVTVIVALGVGWSVDRRQLAERVRLLEGGHWENSASRGAVFVPDLWPPDPNPPSRDP